jgi:hypothetical protein
MFRSIPVSRRRLRLQLEILEGRDLLSILSVTNLSDSDPGSLRDALAQAQAGDLVDFAPDVRGTISLTSGELDIGQSVSITGPGADQLAISGGMASRVFEVFAGTNVYLSGLTVTAGRLTPTGTNTATGAGIDNHGTLTVTNCAVTGNTIAGGSNSTGEGGGVFNDGNLTVLGGSVSNDSAGGDVGLGGGIWNGTGTLVVLDSTIANDHAGGIGGGYGGGVYSAGGTAILTGCTLSGSITDRPGGGGGGLFIAFGTAALTNCIITDNGGASGAGIHNEGQLTVTGSTLWGNHANFPGSSGGGLYNEGGAADLVASTIADNVIMGTGASGGGVSTIRGVVTLTGCTVTGNGTPGNGADGGGGLSSSEGSGSLRLLNTIVAGNVSGSGAIDVSGPVDSLGHNLVGVIDGSTGWVDSDLTGTAGAPLDPMLGPLGDYGGPTPTVPPLAGSPALDAGDPALLGTPDQRGVMRGGGVNIGAFQATAAFFVIDAPNTVTAGEPFDVTVTALDPYGQVAVGYAGGVDLTSTDPDAGDLGSHTLTLDDGGTFTFAGVTQYTEGPQTLSATDGLIVGQFDLTVMSGHLRRR